MTDQPIPPAPPPPSAVPVNSRAGASGRAITALILGIAAFLCCGFLAGIPAFFIGRSEEKAINRGESSEAGRTMAKVGWILGLVSIILSCLSAIGFGIYFAMVGIPQIPSRF